MASRPVPHAGRTLTLTVPASLGGERLDRTLAQMIPSLSRSYVKKLVKDGYCRVNGSRASPRDPVEAGDVIMLSLTEPITLPCRPVPGSLDVRYEDGHVLVVAKGAGIVSHPSKGHHSDSLLNVVVSHLLPEIERGWSRPHLVSRLDQYTSGLVLIAKTPRAQRGLQRQMDARGVQRRYFALVWGRPEPPRGVFEEPVGERPGSGGAMMVTGAGRPARTEYVVTRTFLLPPDRVPGGCPAMVSAVRARLGTGRTHQVRVHFAHAGHAVLGDDTYGPARTEALRDAGLRKAIDALGGYALHAGLLVFQHPVSGDVIRVVAAPPQPLLGLIAWLDSRAGNRAAEGEP